MSRLRVDFEAPVHGGMEIRMRAGDLEFSSNGSYTPNDWPNELIDALVMVLAGDPRREVVVPLGSAEHVFTFTLDAADTVVTVREYLGRRERESTFTDRFLYRAPTAEVCLAFWRGLRQLQTRITPEEYERQWRRPFPSVGVEILGRKLGR